MEMVNRFLKIHPCIFVGICYILISICNATTTLYTRKSGTSWRMPHNDPTAWAAFEFLLKGASFYIDKSPRGIIFKRPGGKLAAFSDFYALNPTNVRHVNEITETEIHGFVGKREVVLSLGKRRSSGKVLFPQISITSFEPGKDPENNFFMLVFWYMGDLGVGPSEEIIPAASKI